MPSRLSALCAALPVGVTGIEADEAASLVGRPAGGRCGSDSANIACRLKASSNKQEGDYCLLKAFKCGRGIRLIWILLVVSSFNGYHLEYSTKGLAERS